MYKFENWTWCRCWLPLLGAIAGRHCWAAIAGDSGGGVGVHVGGLDVVPLLGAIAGCHWGQGGVGVHVGGLDVVALLAALMGAIAGCHCWVPLLGCHCWGWGGWVYTLADWMW